MNVFVIFGCPGSGKTTLSKLLNSDIILEADSFQQLDQFNQQDWKQSRLGLREKLQDFLKSQQFKNIVIDDDLLLLSQRKAILHICQQYKASYIEIYFDLSLEQLLYRNQQRTAKKLNPGILTMIYSKFESKSLKNTIKLNEEYSLHLLNTQILQLSIQHQEEYQSQQFLVSDKIFQITQNKTNKIHQTDLEIRKIITLLCKQYDPKYLSNKKKEFLSQNLEEDIQDNILQFLKKL